MASALVCFSCGKGGADESKFVSCAYCFKCQHLSCKGVFGAAASKLKSKTYFCSVECSSIHSAMPSAGVDNLILEEIRKVSTEVHEMKQAQTKLDGKLDDVLVEVKSMKGQFNSLKTDVEQLQVEQDVVNETICKLQLDLDRINRAAIAKNAVILGVPVVDDENVNQLVHNIAKAVGCELPADAIEEATRLVPKGEERATNRTAPIKVIFSELAHKESLFTKKKSHGLLQSSVLDPTGSSTGGTRIILRDEMTAFGINLLKEVRSVQEKTDLKYVWAGRNGVVLAKRTEHSKIEKIRSMQDVQKLERAQSKRTLDNSLLHSTSINDEPAPKRR